MCIYIIFKDFMFKILCVYIIYTFTLWYYDIMILWYYDIMILRYYDIMILWYYDIMILWYYIYIHICMYVYIYNNAHISSYILEILGISITQNISIHIYIYIQYVLWYSIRIVLPTLTSFLCPRNKAKGDEFDDHFCTKKHRKSRPEREQLGTWKTRIW